MNSRESKPVAILNVSSQRGFDEKSGKENISKGKNEENKKHKKNEQTGLPHSVIGPMLGTGRKRLLLQQGPIEVLLSVPPEKNRTAPVTFQQVGLDRAIW